MTDTDPSLPRRIITMTQTVINLAGQRHSTPSVYMSSTSTVMSLRDYIIADLDVLYMKSLECTAFSDETIIDVADLRRLTDNEKFLEHLLEDDDLGDQVSAAYLKWKEENPS